MVLRADAFLHGFVSLTTPLALSKNVPHADLHFARVAQAGLYGAVEVEEQARGGGVPVVVCVEQVEDLDNGLQSSRSHRNRSRKAHVPREEPVILAQGVALDDADVGADPVGRGPPRDWSWAGLTPGCCRHRRRRLAAANRSSRDCSSRRRRAVRPAPRR